MTENNQHTDVSPLSNVVIQSELAMTELEGRLMTGDNAARSSFFKQVFPPPIEMEILNVIRGKVVWRIVNSKLSGSQYARVFSAFNGLCIRTEERVNEPDEYGMTNWDYIVDDMVQFVGVSATESTFMKSNNQFNVIEHPVTTIGGMQDVVNTNSNLTIEFGDYVYVRPPRYHEITQVFAGGGIDRSKKLAVVERLTNDTVLTLPEMNRMISGLCEFVILHIQNPDRLKRTLGYTQASYDQFVARVNATQPNALLRPKIYRETFLKAFLNGRINDNELMALRMKFGNAMKKLFSRFLGMAVARAAPGKSFSVHVRQVAL